MARSPKVSKDQLVKALEESNGDFAKARAYLDDHYGIQVDLSTVYRRAARYGIQVREERRVVAA